LIAIASVSMLGCAEPSGAGDACRIAIDADEQGNLRVTIENDLIRAVYAGGITNGHIQSYIRQFVLRSADQSQGSTLDSSCYRTHMTDAEIIRDEPDVKTVRMSWSWNKFSGPAISEVTIRPGDPYLQIHYVTNAFAHICDIGSPGGVHAGARVWKEGKSLEGSHYVIHGAEQWQQVRQAMDRPDLREHENPHCRLTNDLYPVYPSPLIDKGWGDTPMNYNGWYIMGLYHESNGRGYGRVVPADVMHYIKLLWGTGFEFFPHWRSRWRPYTGYLYVVDGGGAEEILSVGRQIADAAGPPHQTQGSSDVRE
jgi:hypothetical protein